MRISAFRALHPPPGLAETVSCPPYDAMDRETSLRIAKDNPRSFVHVIRAETSLPADADEHEAAVYSAAATALRRLQDEGSIEREDVPCLYVYRQQTADRHVQSGVVACCSTREYEDGCIRKHELTRAIKEDDRVRLAHALQAYSGPVFVTYRDDRTIDSAVDDIQRQTPLCDFTKGDGVRHTLWRVRDTEPLIRAFGGVPHCYIADGHHRAAAAARIAKERNAEREQGDDSAWFPCVVFPASQLRIFPIHRCVRDLGGMSAEKFIEKVGGAFTVTKVADGDPTGAGKIRMVMPGQWYELEARDSGGGDPVSDLDVSRLQRDILSPLLGITDPRTDARVEYVEGARGVDALPGHVNAGRAAVGFSLHPVTVEQVMRIADAGMIMPPKTTWFAPKILSGLFVHTFGG